MKRIDENMMQVVGVLESAPVLDHTTNDGVKQYAAVIRTQRISGVWDRIPMLAGQDRLPAGLQGGETVEALGEARTFDQFLPDGKRRLIVRMHVELLRQVAADTPHEDRVWLEGEICRKPVFRVTPLGKRICDVMVAVNRAGGSSYLPCIAWKGWALVCARLPVGQRLALKGRMQSRTYNKKLPDGSAEERTAYEVSAYYLEAKDGKTAVSVRPEQKPEL